MEKTVLKKIQKILEAEITFEDIKQITDGYVVDWYCANFWEDFYLVEQLRDAKFPELFYFINLMFMANKNIEIEIDFNRDFFDKMGEHVKNEPTIKTKVFYYKNDNILNGFNYVIDNVCYTFAQKEDLDRFKNEIIKLSKL
jgi:hypothetical protein